MNFTTKHIVRAHQKASCKAILQELRFVELFGCLPSSHDRLNENVYGRGSMLQCPSGALLHIQSVQLGHRPHSDEPCLLSEDEESAKANKHAMLDAQKKETLHNFQCSSGDVKSEVQSLCNGLNTCDILSKLSRLYQSSECPYRRTLFVNYTCLPAYSQTELICADSYVEITCATHGTAFKLLILEAKSLHNMSVEPQVSHLVGKNQCTRTDSSAHEVLLKPSEVSPVRTVKKKPEKKAKKHETRDFVIDQVQDDSYKNWATEKGIKPGKEIPFVGPADDAQMKQKETSFQIGANAGQQAEKPMTDADSSYVLLASLIPSVLCLLLTRAPLSLKSCSLCETSEAPKNSQAWPVEKQAVRSIASTVLNAPSVVATNSESPVFEGTTLLSTPGNLSMQVGSPLTESRNATSLRQSEMRFRVPPPLFTHMDKSPFSFSGHLILSSKPNNKLNNKAIRRVPVVRYPHEVEENSDEDKLSVVEEPKEDMITPGTQHTQAPLKYNRPDLCPSVNESEELKHKRSKTVSTWKQLNESCYGTGYLSAVETTGEAYTRETFAQCTPSTPLLSYRAFPDRLGTKFTGFKTPMNENNRDTAISSEMSSSSIIFPSGKPR
ncbi:hypothetical protein CLF_104280 [Clonorchis sinensis]|uniref:SUEL-type lectin domain-containing protein n=1 Tax=Clonorchis sinensis TaxID=79923 RepID=G7YBB0_CLOSI|nr:hypothetical protein CLF_104280 [Clonorchis sinensis]